MESVVALLIVKTKLCEIIILRDNSNQIITKSLIFDFLTGRIESQACRLSGVFFDG